MKRFIKTLALCLMLIQISACEDFIKIDPPHTELVSETVFSSDFTAISAISGIYSEMMNTSGFSSGGTSSITVLAGLSADELVDYTGSDALAFQENSLTPTNSAVKSSLWEPGYKYIYYSNSILEGLSKSTAISESVKRQLEGEAKFIRAFCYFYLTNLFGEVPLITNTNYLENLTIGKTSPEKIYDQIISDLQNAKELLTEDYSFAGDQRVRPNKYAAAAMLARVFLYNENWDDAEIEASFVLDNVSLYNLENDLDKVFLANSNEAILQLMPVYSGYNTWEGVTFILTGYPTFTAIREEAIDAFELEDARKSKWISSISVDDQTYYFPYKYKIGYQDPVEGEAPPVTEYSMVLRLAEQYLIRAEARANLDKLSEAINDVDMIRQRAELDLIQDTNPGISKDQLLTVIDNENRLEFFSEWGHRWLDLKRRGMADETLEPIKTAWQSTDVLYPIPQTEIQNDPNLKPQNPGY